MGFTDKITLKRAKATGINSVAIGTNMSGLGTEGAPNADKLREYVRTNSFVNAAVVLRKAQVSSADYDILPKGPNIKITPAMEKVILQIKALLNSPNPDGRNTSFGGLLEPVIDDVLTLGFGAIMPVKNTDGEVASLHYIDAGRVRFMPGWTSVEDGPRYILMNPDNRTGKQLNNDELITIVLNPTTYNETGTSPVMVLRDKLEAAFDSFRSAWVTQKNRAPAGLLNLEGMSETELRKVKRLFETELEGNSTIGFLNHTTSEMKFIELGSIDLEKQGTTWFMDFLVKNICAAFQVSPISLQWTQDINRAVAREQLKITGDQGIVPLMKSMAGIINREIVGSFQGADQIEFVWSELIVKDEAQSAETIRKRAGTTGQWTTVNELRRADGLEPLHTDPDDNLYPWYNETLILVGTSTYAPISIASQLPQYQTADDVLKAQIAQAEANKNGGTPNNDSTQPPQDSAEAPQEAQGDTGKPNKDQAGKAFWPENWELDQEED